MRKRRVLAFAGVWLAATLACNLSAPQDDAADLAGMITANASTLQARAGSATPGTVAAPSEAEAEITSATACREGPDQGYAILFTVDAGQTLKLIGRNTATGYWIVANPTGGICWLPAQAAEARGDTSRLPELPLPPPPTAGATRTPEPTRASKTPKPSQTPPPTLTATIGVPYTPGVPSFPTYVTVTKTCASTMVAADKYWIQDNVLTWQDTADNETGYRIYVASKSSAAPGLGDTLGPNVTQYVWQEQYTEWSLQFDPYQQLWVAAFNDVGESIRMGAVLWRCP